MSWRATSIAFCALKSNPTVAPAPRNSTRTALFTVPDGLAFDAVGNLYVTTYGSSCIYRVSPNRSVELLCQDIEE